MEIEFKNLKDLTSAAGDGALFVERDRYQAINLQRVWTTIIVDGVVVLYYCDAPPDAVEALGRPLVEASFEWIE